MVQFPSEEWVKQFVDALNSNKAYEEAAKNWEGDFIFIIKPEGNLKEEVLYYFDLWHGKCREFCRLPTVDAKKAAFIITGPYSVWQQVMQKKLDPIKALMQGKFKLKGDMAKIMKAVKAAQELVNTVAKVQTEFL